MFFFGFSKLQLVSNLDFFVSFEFYYYKIFLILIQALLSRGEKKLTRAEGWLIIIYLDNLGPKSLL